MARSMIRCTRGSGNLASVCGTTLSTSASPCSRQLQEKSAASAALCLSAAAGDLHPVDDDVQAEEETRPLMQREQPSARPGPLRPAQPLGAIGCALVFIGFNVTFFTQFVLGTRGMPRRYYDYLPEFTLFHQLSTYGAYVLLLGFLVIAAYLLHSLFYGEIAPANPWGGASMEWKCSSPPPHDNFAETPEVSDPYDFSHVHFDEATQTYGLPVVHDA